MPTPALPSYIKLRLAGFGHKRPKAVLRTDTEDGMAKQTEVKSRVLVRRSVTFAVDLLEDYNSFMTWYRGDIHYGATWFSWTDPVDGASKLARIVDGTLDDRPLNRALSKWDISFELETWSA